MKITPNQPFVRTVTITMTERQARILAAVLGSSTAKEFAEVANRAIERNGLPLKPITDINIYEEDDVSSIFYRIVKNMVMC